MTRPPLPAITPLKPNAEPVATFNVRVLPLSWTAVLLPASFISPWMVLLAVSAKVAVTGPLAAAAPVPSGPPTRPRSTPLEVGDRIGDAERQRAGLDEGTAAIGLHRGKRDIAAAGAGGVVLDQAARSIGPVVARICRPSLITPL